MVSGFRFKFCVLMTAMLVVGGCQTQSKRTIYTDPKYTQADATDEAVRNEAKVLSPMEAHLRARAQVDPNDTSSTHAYTKLATLEDAGPVAVPAHKPPRVTTAFKTAKATFINPEPLKAQNSVKSAGKPVHALAAVASVEPASGVSMVKSVRLGEHPGKTRFVLDLTGPAGFKHEVNNEKGYILVTLSEAAWDTKVQEILKAHPLIKGYSVRSDQTGARLLVALKKPGKLISSAALPPNDTRGHRIYFDIGGAG